jgi:hypothetical protein
MRTALQSAALPSWRVQLHNAKRLSVPFDGAGVPRLGELTALASPSALVGVETRGTEAAMELLLGQPLEFAVAAARDVEVSLPPRHHTPPLESAFAVAKTASAVQIRGTNRRETGQPGRFRPIRHLVRR